MSSDRLRARAAAALLAAASAGCAETSDFFHVRRDGALLPVLVTGDRDQDVLIVVLHGGPGASSIFDADEPAFETLANDYALAFWDQRGSGASQGNPPADSYSLEAFTDDTAAVLSALDERYGERDVFLLGHSWGGAVGTAYLLDASRQAGVSGWIEVDGAHDFSGAMPASREFVIAHAESRESSQQWREALDWYAQTPEIRKEDLTRHATYVAEANGYFHDPEIQEREQRRYVRDTLAGPYNGLAFLLTQREVAQRIDILELSIEEELSALTLPTLLLWGEHDGLIPVSTMDATAGRLGTDPIDVHAFAIAEAAHNPQLEQPAEFARLVGDFIDQYRSR